MEHLETCRAFWAQKAVVETLSEQLALESKKLEGIKLTALKQMDALELTKQHIPGQGTIYVQTKYSVKTPKTMAEKLALFDYIKSTKGEETLNGLLSIHSATLNSFYDSELETAKERGDHRWALPGVGEPEMYKVIAARRE